MYTAQYCFSLLPKKWQCFSWHFFGISIDLCGRSWFAIFYSQVKVRLCTHGLGKVTLIFSLGPSASLWFAFLWSPLHLQPLNTFILYFFSSHWHLFFFFFYAVWLLQTGQIRRQSSQLQRGSDQTWGQRRECGLAKPRKEILGDALAWQRTLFLTVHHILAECKYQDKIFICTFFFSSNFLLQGLLNANRDIGRNGVQWRVLHYFWSFVFVHFVFSSFGVGWREKVREFIDFLLLPFLYLFTQGVLSVTHYTRPKSHVMPTRVTSKLSPTMILS